MGKSTISTGPFSSSQTVNVYQRVHESLANFHNIFLFAIILCDWLGWFTIWSPWKIPMSASSSVHMSFSRRDSLQRSTAVRALFTFDSVGARNYSQLFLVYPSLFLQHLGVWHLVYFWVVHRTPGVSTGVFWKGVSTLIGTLDLVVFQVGVHIYIYSYIYIYAPDTPMVIIWWDWFSLAVSNECI